MRDNRGTTTMTYESGNDRVQSVTDPVTGTTAYTYEPSGERKSMTLPGGGTWTYTYYTRPVGDTNALEVLPSDDPNSVTRRLITITDDQGRRLDLSPDAANSPANGPGAQRGFGGTGRLFSLRSDQTYDSLGNLMSYLETVYDYPSIMEYQQQGLPWADQGAVHTVTTTWNYKIGSGAGSGSGPTYHRLVSQNVYTYDDTGARLSNTVTQMTPGSGGGPQYAGGSPQYDANNLVSNLVTSQRTETYGYDKLNRLSSVDYGDGQTQGYAFDAMGNRLSRQDSASGTTNYAYDAANMLLSTGGAGASGFQNDADGNTLSGNGRTNAWDSQNRLVSGIAMK